MSYLAFHDTVQKDSVLLAAKQNLFAQFFFLLRYLCVMFLLQRISRSTALPNPLLHQPGQ